MTRAGLISVVIPTRNRADVVSRALESARAQTYRNIEIIVIDDASTDGTSEILSEIASHDERIRVIRLEQRSGGAAARNVGIRAAEGAFVAFLDDDDAWLREKLEQQAGVVERHPGVGLVYCGTVIMDDVGQQRLGPLSAPRDMTSALLRENFIATSTALVRRELLEVVHGFDERLPRLQDWDLWIRLSRVTRFVLLPQRLVHYHLTTESISADGGALMEASALLLSRLEPELATRDLGEFCYTLGHIHLASGQRAKGKQLLRRSVALHPWSLRHLGMLIIAHIGRKPFDLACATHSLLLNRRRARHIGEVTTERALT